MTFQEYLKQQDPKRHPRVFIKRSDCYGFHEGSLPYGRAIVDLEIHGEHYLYLLSDNSENLWTMDEDGNPKARSCFYYKKNG